MADSVYINNIYIPDEKVLRNLANVLINFALNSGQGIKKGEVVYVVLNEIAKPMILPIQEAILKAGGHMILNYLPDWLERDRDATRLFYQLANEEQLNFFPEEYIRARVNTMDHMVQLLSSYSHNYYKDIDQNKIAQRNRVWKKYMEMRSKKEYEGRLTWVLAEYPSPAMAEAAQMTIEEYWDQVIKACYLDEDDPIAKHKETMQRIQTIQQKLNSLGIESLHIEGEDVDLKIVMGESRLFVGGTGRNIPSFEVFTSPDARYTSGWIRFNQPLYRNGQVIKGIKLEFEEGKVVNFSAEENYEALKAMLETDEGARRVGEFSLTDKRFSKINKIMANTLFDENFGGEYGNTHIALGQSYRDTIANQEKYSDEQLKEMGFNDSAIHVDIISTSNRRVTAKLKNGSEMVIYENGEFQGLDV
ncbi:aminopeptidase [Candidatus Dojkabacteria bacterium]|uniref:Aminopeptidase n=1 Tax=Candidatus Dojkabacteria bacterium TaxID=2099670 RepID=A0A3M0YXX0_9BACT|nr:MAG: aminopeptidase [Candidatus Dojkabacteria bacterium]